MAEIGPLNTLLYNYLDAVEGIEAAVIVRSDGGIFTSVIRPGFSEEEMGALTELIRYISDVIRIDFETGYIRRSASQISTPGKSFSFTQINNQSVLIAICNEKLDRRVLNAYNVYTSNKIGKILKGESIPLEIPKNEGQLREGLTPDHEFVFKTVIIGDSGVGKTTTTVRFAHSKFKSEYKPTVGVSIVKNEYWIGKNLATFQIWDIAGHSQWKPMRRIYYGGSQGCLILYDITNPKSFENVKMWLNDLKTFIPSGIPCILCANKIDLVDERKVSREQGEALATELSMSYIETSAKTAENINEVFLDLGQKLIENYLKDKA